MTKYFICSQMYTFLYNQVNLIFTQSHIYATEQEKKRKSQHFAFSQERARNAKTAFVYGTYNYTHIVTGLLQWHIVTGVSLAEMPLFRFL